jgi:hypothetical protein
MKKLNLICAAAAVLFAGAANAGNLTSATSGGTRFATEIFGTGTDATTTVRPGVVTYSVATTNGIVVNAGGKLYLTIKLTGGEFRDGAGVATAPAAGTIGGSALDVGGAGNGAVSAPTVSADGTTVAYTITYTNAATLGVGATLTYTPATGDIRNVKSTLSTAGGQVSATAGLSALGSSATAANGVVPADVDGPAGTAPIAQAVTGFTAAVAANPAAWTTRIDVTGANPGTVFTAVPNVSSTTTAPLAQVTFTTPTTPAVQADGSTALSYAAFTAAGASATVAVTPVSGSFAVNATTPTSLKLVAGSDCTGATLGSTVNITAANASGPITLTLAQADFTALAGATHPVSVCYTTPGGLQLPQVAAGVTVTANPATALTNYASRTGTGTGYQLNFNGALVTTPGYFPAAISQFGYRTYVRVVNTGTTATAINAAFVTQNTGGVGAALALPLPANYGATLAPGASVTWTGAQVESVLGAPGVNDRPRLQISGTTSTLRVQHFIETSSGVFTEVTGSVGN